MHQTCTSSYAVFLTSLALHCTILIVLFTHHYHRCPASTAPSTGLMMGWLWLLSLFFLLFVVAGEFEPYKDNSGTVVGIAGHDFCLLAADSRLSEQYLIHSRNYSRILTVGNNLMFAGTGCLADLLELQQDMRLIERAYAWRSDTKLTAETASFRLSSLLYSRRRFPFYSFTGLAGLNKHGWPSLYRFDAIGSCEQVRAFCCGRGEALIQPALDALTKLEEDPSYWGLDTESASFVSNNRWESAGEIEEDGCKMDFEGGTTGERVCIKDLSTENALEVVVSAFRAAAEREITIGDGLHVWILYRESYPERCDMDVTEEQSKEISDQQVHFASKAATRGNRFTRNLHKLYFSLPRH